MLFCQKAQACQFHPSQTPGNHPASLACRAGGGALQAMLRMVRILSTPLPGAQHVERQSHWRIAIVEDDRAPLSPADIMTDGKIEVSTTVAKDGSFLSLVSLFWRLLISLGQTHRKLLRIGVRPLGSVALRASLTNLFRGRADGAFATVNGQTVL